MPGQARPGRQVHFIKGLNESCLIYKLHQLFDLIFNFGGYLLMGTSFEEKEIGVCSFWYGKKKKKKGASGITFSWDYLCMCFLEP